MERTVRIRLLNGKGEVLLVLEKGGIIGRSDGDSFHKFPGWGLPGGRVKAGEDPRVAAIRELLEETGYEAEIGLQPVHIEKRGEHEIWLFKAVDPVQKSEECDDGIACLRWMNPHLVYGTLNWLGEPFRVYGSHLPMIHNLF
jgi:8-oxo-dGTP pyrophosphatase MutT (NUDIX family)